MYKCFICNKKIFNFGNLVSQNINSYEFTKRFTFIKNYCIHHVNNQLVKILSEFSYFIDNEWTKSFEVDYHLPKAISLYSVLGYSTFFCKLLNSRKNLSLAHKQCNKKK